MPTGIINFPTRQYLSEYYQSIDFENYALMSFLHRAYSFIGKRQRLLDVGSGPTIYQFASASKVINKIVASEPLLSNRREILSWLAEDSDAFNWDAFITHAAVLEGKEGSQEDCQYIKDRMRKCITSVIPCDIHNEEPLFISVEELFDVASAHFCLEAASGTIDEFLYCLRNVLRVITPDGFFIASLLKEAHYYAVSDTWLPSLAVNETLIEELFTASGLVLLRSETITVEPQRGYQGIILCLSRKRCR